MPSVNSRSMPNVWPSSTFTTPSLPTFSMASAMTSPISSSLADMLDDLVDGDLDAALQAERVGAGGHVLQALAHDRLGEHGRGRRAVAGDVVGRRGDLADELCALVLERVLDLDLAGDGDAVVGDRRGAELLVQHDVAALRAERHLDRVGEDVHAALERAARILVELELLVSHVSLPPEFCWLDRCAVADDLREDVRLAQNEHVVRTDL